MTVEEVAELTDPNVQPVFGTLFVAEDAQGTVVGTCTLTRHQHRMQRHRAEITGFVIGTGHRGTGLARRVVDHVADHARSEWQATILEIDVRGGTHAETAYRGLGFVEWGRLPGGLDDQGTVYDDVRLYRAL